MAQLSFSHATYSTFGKELTGKYTGIILFLLFNSDLEISRIKWLLPSCEKSRGFFEIAKKLDLNMGFPLNPSKIMI